jgi:O-Antigen ligase
MNGQFWPATATTILFGYCLMGRSFAYLGIPPWHLFLGEIVLALFLVAGPVTARRPWVAVARQLPQLKQLMWAFVALFAYGIAEVVHGAVSGYSPLTAVRDFAFNYYPLFLLLGMWIGLRDPGFPARLVRPLAWFNAFYGLAYIAFLNRLDWNFAGVSKDVTDVPIFGAPEFSFVVLLGLLVFEPEISRVWHLLLLNSFVLLGMQVRAEWLAFTIGLLTWGWLTKRLKKMAAFGAMVAVLLAAMYAVNFSVPGPESRGGGDISARDLIGRAFAPIDPELAAEYTSSSSYRMDVGTAVWRTIWWVAIWEQVHQSPRTMLIGLGYGYPLGDLVSYLQDEFIQTPHNVFFYALGYGGWLGVAIFGLFQFQIARLLWAHYRKTGQPSGFVLWIAMLAFAIFTPFFEVPQGAIPFYVLLGGIAGTSLFQKPMRVAAVRAPVGFQEA